MTTKIIQETKITNRQRYIYDTVNDASTDSSASSSLLKSGQQDDSSRLNVTNFF
jgi:hypothetical protein